MSARRWTRALANAVSPALRTASASNGFVTFVHFTCQPCCPLKDRAKENQSFGALDVGAKSTENGLFLPSVTMP
jgi:hypothetical protein